MKTKHSVLYDSVIEEIKRISDSNVAEDFEALIDDSDPNSDDFVLITEKLRGLGADLVEARSQKEHFERWSEIFICMEEFATKFSSFPNLKFAKRTFELILLEKLAQIAPVLDSADIDDEQFELRELSKTLPIHLFVHQNNRTFSDSTVIFSLADTAAFKTALAQSNISSAIYFHLLAAVQTASDLNFKHYALIKKSVPAIGDAEVEAFCRLALLSTGHSVHVPHTYSFPPKLIDRDSLQAGIAYNQMNEIMYVLSEYNSHTQILSKYLTLYHVIENFMYRMPIAKLEQSQGGAMFSIRDFQRLYKEVEEKEMPAIRKLFAAIARCEYEPGKTFRNKFISNWNVFNSCHTPASMQNELGKFNLKKDGRAMSGSEFIAGDLPGNFAQLVYGARCAIVHNKETEFHLTYANLEPNTVLLMESFLIPTLEEICFHLVSKTNPIVWYTNSEIKLFA